MNEREGGDTKLWAERGEGVMWLWWMREEGGVVSSSVVGDVEKLIGRLKLTSSLLPVVGVTFLVVVRNEEGR